MSPMFGPILAQLVTLAVGDRTEARAVRSDAPHLEVSTYPQLALSVGWKNTTLSLGYGAAINVGRVETNEPAVSAYQNASATGTYAWQRTTVSVNEVVTYGQVNFQQAALGAPGAQPGIVPTTPGGTTPPPATGVAPPPGTAQPPGTTVPPANQLRAPENIIWYLSSTTTLTVNNDISKAWSVGGGVGYRINGAIKGDTSSYPVARGVLAEAHASHRFTPVDATNLMLNAQTVSATGNEAFLVFGAAGWGHAWSEHTTTQLGSGLSVTRNSQSNGLVFWSVYPNFLASISHIVPQGRSALAFGSALVAAPAIDPIRAAVDPRLSWSGTASWSLDRFSTGLSFGTAISVVQQSDQGAFTSLYAAYTAAYRLGDVVSVDAGLRAFRQSIVGEQQTPGNYAAFVGLNIATSVPKKR